MSDDLLKMTYEIWDVFTSEKFAGNPLAVVRGAAGLSTHEMQKIAAEFNLSETTFILPPEHDSHIARVRIFTPSYEMPFAGHPTIGTSLSIAKANGTADDFILGLTAGPTPISFTQEQEGLKAKFTAPDVPLRFDDLVNLEVTAQALSLPLDKIETAEAAPALCGIPGVRFLYVKTDKNSVQNAALTISDYTPLEVENIVGLYVYAAEDTDAVGSNGIYARMFAPEAGILEDPATGAAAVGLAAHLPDKPVSCPTGRTATEVNADIWTIRQGVDMGRPSAIEMSRFFEPKNDASHLKAVSIAGSAVEMMRGEFL